jgi:hypothetical protein
LLFRENVIMRQTSPLRAFLSVLTAVVIGLALSTSPAPAQQSGTAGIYGSVVDAQGAVIAGASVTLTHLERNQVRAANTNDVGQFVFPLLSIGSYRIRVEQPGFKAFEQTGIELQVNDNRRIDVSLEVGDVTTRVQVEAAAATLETSNATIKNVVDGKRVLELPLNGRNVLQLGTLVPGVVSAGTSLAGNSKQAADNQKFSINGSRQNSTKFTLDGGDNQDNLTNVNAPYPFPDAVEEFSVQTSNAGAAGGKSAAGAVNVVTKSGTNEFHGSAFWFLRNHEFNAGSFFLHQSDNLKRNQVGGTFGGPIKRDKLFFFGGVQRSWMRTTPTESKALTMPAAYRGGDFSGLLAQSKPVTLKDPTTNQPFPNNQIPSSRLSPAALNLLKDSPVPTSNGFTYWRQRVEEDPKDYILRVDWRPNTTHSLLARYLQNSDLNSIPFVPGVLHSVVNTESSFSKNATLGYTFVAGPSLIADSHLTMSRTTGRRWNFWPKTIADYGVKVNPTSNQIAVSINGTSGLSLSTTNSLASFARTNLEATHSWRWIKGRHNLGWGADIMFSRYNEYNYYQGSGAYGFKGRFTGLDQADFLLGLMSSFFQSNGEIECRRHHYQGFYFDDSFRLSRRLTLNYGVRWEPYTPITDLNDRQVQFRPEEYLKGTKSARYLNAPPGLFYPGDTVGGETINKSGVTAGKKQFAPRIGVAWDVTGDGSTSVRAGYGIYYDTPMMYLLNNMNLQAPFSFTVGFTDGSFDNPYQGRQNLNLFPFSGDFAKDSPFQVPMSAIVYQSRWRQPYTQNWSLTLERRVASWLFHAAYVGSKGTHLISNYDANAPVYDYSKTLSQNQDTINERRPMRQFQDMAMLFTGLNSIYNGLQMSVNKRFSRGFSVIANYTWSRAIDVISSNTQATSGVVWNPSNFKMMRGPSDWDRTHLFTSSFVWTLPKPGKALNSRPLAIVADDWQLSGILSATTGAPLSFTSSNDPMAGEGNNISNKAQAALVGDPYLGSGRSRGEQIQKYFNTAAIVNASPGTWGNLGRGALRGPGGSGTDVSMTRIIPLHRLREGMNVMFRAEFFSLFNHPQLGAPQVRLGRAPGTIQTVTGQRVLQFGLKIAF